MDTSRSIYNLIRHFYRAISNVVLAKLFIGYKCQTQSSIKGINTAVQLGSLVRFIYHINTNYTKRGASVAASGKAFDY